MTLQPCTVFNRARLFYVAMWRLNCTTIKKNG